MTEEESELEFTPLEFETTLIYFTMDFAAELEFTPLEFETYFVILQLDF